MLTMCQQMCMQMREENRIMIKGTPELIAERREEILNACEHLYRTMSFREITIKEISKVTSFSRPTIYNYFETREEIFLALFEREYKRWNEDLKKILDENDRLTGEEVAEKIAHSLEKRQQLLKLLSMNNFDMEANSRKDMLVSFKAAYGESMSNIIGILEKFCPEMSGEKIRNFIYVFFPFMFGIYPYTTVTDRQREAMKEAGVDFEYQSVYRITYGCLAGLLIQ